MKHLDIKYKSWGMARTVSADIPETLSEATTQQFLALLLLSQESITEERFFRMFFGIEERVLALLDPFQLYTLAEQLRGLWNITKTDRFFIGSFHVDDLTFLAPSRQLRDMPFQQFMTADQFFQWAGYTGNDHYYCAMTAALYLPEGTDFFLYDHAAMTELLTSWGDQALMRGIALNWSLIRVWLAEAYPHLFPQPEQSVATDSGSVPKKTRPGSWLTIFDTLVGDDLSRISTYPHLPAMDVIRILNRRIKEQKKNRT
ncbi:MAG: hypothetical protein J5486_04210 [Bacteroidaceae bacterium]|nr:hypothetical protein [Bacteroidaceae bacterium]